MELQDIVTEVERVEYATTLDQLSQMLQTLISGLGFHSFSFILNDMRAPSDPLVINTITQSWEDDYRGNDFLSIDPCLVTAQRTNKSFAWGDVFSRVKTHKSTTLWSAARDHNLIEGLVFPYHFRDRLGTFRSSVCTLFWSGARSDFERVMKANRLQLQIFLTYWAERALYLKEQSEPAPSELDFATGLTDRERDVLTWAAAGKTIKETASILDISVETSTWHMKNAIRKLDAVSKTQAVVRALTDGLIRA